ncbi:unnamed protein product [Psylliodes chrysocephalus]|uniref:Proton-coupled folate transporter n=1 Tax=Psylliodes chrysocephalus TaxID=3402493 RepID=A0A9P0D2Z3_9CUCU|nr:unnamed protein product [Psylliodes chrysocephala]
MVVQNLKIRKISIQDYTNTSTFGTNCKMQLKQVLFRGHENFLMFLLMRTCIDLSTKRYIFKIIGMALGLFIMAVFSYFPNISPWYFLFASIPSMLTGGGCSTVLVITLSYMSDVTTEDTRGVRMAIMEGIIGLGVLFGSTSSSYLFYATNYPSVYAIAGGISTVGILYTIFFVPESLKNINREGEITVKNLLMSFNFKELFRVFTKKRPNYDRAIIFLITTMLTLFMLGLGSGSKTFLFLTSKFSWTLTEYTWYTGVSSIFFMIGGIFGTLIIHKYLKITESIVVLMGFMSEVNGFLIRGLATRSRDIYLCKLKFYPLMK